MALTKKKREEFFEAIRLGIDACLDDKRISTLKVNMQAGDPKWARMCSQVRTKNDKKPKTWMSMEDALAEVDKLVKRVKFGYIHIVIVEGLVIDVLEESQFDLWAKDENS